MNVISVPCWRSTVPLCLLVTITGASCSFFLLQVLSFLPPPFFENRTLPEAMCLLGVHHRRYHCFSSPLTADATDERVTCIPLQMEPDYVVVASRCCVFSFPLSADATGWDEVDLPLLGLSPTFARASRCSFAMSTAGVVGLDETDLPSLETLPVCTRVPCRSPF